MIKQYPYNSNVKLSPHFAAIEFRCKCGKTHDIHISDELVSKLETVIKSLNASKCIITSGYRCPSHSIAVGGSSTDQHTKGTAADCKFYDANNNVINTKKVACAAQDAGMTGIANIDVSYTAIHLDVRTNGKWYGDEVRGSSFSVTDDFYRYYGLPRPNSGITPHVYYRSYTSKWLGEIIDCNDTSPNGYSGIDDSAITGFTARSNIGTLKYRVHIKGGSWLGWCSGYSTSDWINSIAGNHKPIDGIQLKLENAAGHHVKYRVSTIGDIQYLPWVTDDSDYAGKFGYAIDRIQVKIV